MLCCELLANAKEMPNIAIKPARIRYAPAVGLALPQRLPGRQANTKSY